MHFRGRALRSIGRWGVIGLILIAPAVVCAQNNNVSGVAGVAVDAQGVLRTKVYSDPGGLLMKERIAAAKATLDPKVTAFSKLRKVSLNRLEQTIVDHQGTLTDDMRYLAGLQRVRYVFYYPDSKDIVLAGPAEGWAPDVAGRVVGLTSRRPVIQLQDLVVALRAFPSGGKATPVIGCSIDPTQEGLAALQQFLRTNSPDPGNPTPFIEAMRNSRGMDTVRVTGISPKTHFAQVLVEADYRMKLIGIGLEKPPVKLVSYVDRAKPSSSSALQRWFFLPDYQCVRQSDDKLAMELVGDGVKLVGEDEMVAADGQRQTSGTHGNKASQAFVTAFTKRYPELAERSPVYAELRNLIDLVIAAAYIQQEDYCTKAGWEMAFFGNEQEFPVETSEIPQTVESAVNAIWKGQTLMTPIAGGVQIQPSQALASGNLLTDEKAKVSKLRETIKPNLTKGQWWWD